jgi:hypothetical protein
MSTLLPCNYFTHSASAGGHRGQPLETPLGAVGGPEGGPAASNREPGPPPYPVRMAWLARSELWARQDSNLGPTDYESAV